MESEEGKSSEVKKMQSVHQQKDGKNDICEKIF